MVEHLVNWYHHLHPLMKITVIVVIGIIFAIIAEIIANIHEKRLEKQDAKRYHTENEKESP